MLTMAVEEERAVRRMMTFGVAEGVAAAAAAAAETAQTVRGMAVAASLHHTGTSIGNVAVPVAAREVVCLLVEGSLVGAEEVRLALAQEGLEAVLRLRPRMRDQEIGLARDAGRTTFRSGCSATNASVIGLKAGRLTEEEEVSPREIVGVVVGSTGEMAALTIGVAVTGSAPALGREIAIGLTGVAAGATGRVAAGMTETIEVWAAIGGGVGIVVAGAGTGTVAEIGNDLEDVEIGAPLRDEGVHGVLFFFKKKIYLKNFSVLTF